MVMESQFGGFHDYQSVNGAVSPGPLNYAGIFNYKDPSVELGSLDIPTLQADYVFTSSTTTSSSSGLHPPEEAGSPEDSDTDAVFRYIRQVLMEENIDQNPCMFHDPLALQAAEKPFYDVLGKKYPSLPNPVLVEKYATSPDQHPLSDQFFSLSPEETISGTVGDSRDGSGITGLVDSALVSGTIDDSKSSCAQAPSNYSAQTATTSLRSFSSSSTLASISDSSLFGSNPSILLSSIFSDTESMKLFQKGAEEASKFLPKTSNLLINLDNINLPQEPKKEIENAVVSPESNDYSAERPRARKAHYLDESDTVLEEERRSKQSAISVEETDDLSEYFDKVLLCGLGKHEPANYYMNSDPKGLDNLRNAYRRGVDHEGGTNLSNKPDNDEKNVVDLRTLLILCAQAATSDDRRTAYELLKQIRKHSSPAGDGSQRLAHFFADALEARLGGTGSQIYTALASKRTTASEVIKAYHLFVSSCPFKKVSLIFPNYNILKLAEKRSKLHIIDFGILYGFQWPVLIQRLSEREGGPPELRITGIELPQPGFCPAERVEATGHRLAKYCEKFNVPFKYHAIAQKWETIKVKDLKIDRDELVVVNCHYRLRNLLDETIVVDSPRDTVLKLIKDIRPSLFVQGIVNGSFNAPFFSTRFREALFHYSTLFDMFDTNVSRENPERAMYEREFYGREIMNIVACEGTERVERPETYKQWQVRNTRSGFRQLPLDPLLIEKLKDVVRRAYHKDFLIDVDGSWTLLGWKGRITYAISAWVPS